MSRVQTESWVVEGQHQAGLFAKLHEDIRDLIYREVLGEQNVLCLERKVRRFSLKSWVKYTRQGKATDSPSTHVAYYGTFTPRTQLDIIPLLTSCRRVYCELIKLVYVYFTFYFCFLPDFLAFSSTIPLQKLRVMEFFIFRDRDYLSGDNWEKTCSIIADNMPNLHTLWITFQYKKNHMINEQQLLEPLTRIRGLKTFEVIFCWEKSRVYGPTAESIVDAAFKFSRIPSV